MSHLSPLDDISRPLYTVGQVAEMLDVQPRYLRRLDDHDVVTPARSAGGQRRYSREQVDRIAEVRLLADEGLTLAGIRRIFLLQARIAQLEQELARHGSEARAD